MRSIRPGVRESFNVRIGGGGGGKEIARNAREQVQSRASSFETEKSAPCVIVIVREQRLVESADLTGQPGASRIHETLGQRGDGHVHIDDPYYPYFNVIMK